MNMKTNLLAAAAVSLAGFAQAGTIIDSTFNGLAGALPDPAFWQVETPSVNVQNGSGGLAIFSASFTFGVRALNTYGTAPGVGETLTATFAMENIVDSGVSAPTVLSLSDAAYGIQIWASNDTTSGFWGLHIAGQSGEISTTIPNWYLPPTVSLAWSTNNVVLTVNGGGFGIQVVDVATSRPDWVIPTVALQPGMFNYAYSGSYGGNNTANIFVTNASYTSVPEPSTMLMAVLGGAVVVLGLRRRSVRA